MLQATASYCFINRCTSINATDQKVIVIHHQPKKNFLSYWLIDLGIMRASLLLAGLDRSQQGIIVESLFTPC